MNVTLLIQTLWNETNIIPYGNEKIEMISQEIMNGKTHHIFILSFGNASTLKIIQRMEKDLESFGAKSSHDVSSFDKVKQGIDQSICLVIFLDKDIAESKMASDAIAYTVSKKGYSMPGILLQYDESTAASIMNKSIDSNQYLSRLEAVLNVKYQYPHEISDFNDKLCYLINQKCKSVGEFATNNHGMIAFVSRVKKETGKDARMFKNEGERYLLDIDGPFKGWKLFLDIDNLTTLDTLMNEAKTMRVMIVLISRSYLTRPWCLIELCAAIEQGIKIVSTTVTEIDGFIFNEGKNMIVGLTPKSLLEQCKNIKEALEKEGADVKDMVSMIVRGLQNAIAQELNLNANNEILNAQIRVILNKVIQEAAT